MKILNSLKFILWFALLAGTALAQSFRPADSQFTQDFGVDSVNLQDLSVSINIPILQKPGMIPFNLTLQGNSNCEHVVVSVTQHVTVCGIALGKSYRLSGNNQVLGRVSAVGLWKLTPGLSQNMTCVADNMPEVKYSYWVLSGPDGMSYQFPISDYTIVETGGSSCTRGFTDTTLSGGLTVPVSGSGGFVNSITFPDGSVSGACGFCDPFGNALTATSTVYTDIFKDAAVTVTPQSGATGEIYTYQDTGSTSHQIKQILTAETFKTSFGCTWADTTTTGYATTEVDYPDGNNLYFTYESIPGGITGRIYQVTNRTGGTASYTYGSYNCNGIRPNSITRTTVDGATTYTFANLGTNGSTTTVIDPGKNKTVYTFQGTNGAGSPQAGVPLTLTQVQTYQNTGTVASPAYTLLSTTIYCYNGNSTACPTTQAAYPITEKDTYTAPGSKTTYSRTKQLFDSYGNVTSISRYSAFVAIGGGTPDNTTTITYGSWNGSSCVAVGSGIVDKPCRITTTDNASHTLSDELHNYTAKGFPANVSHWSGSTWITSYASVNAANGTVATTTNPLGLVTTYTYTGGCNGLLPTATSATLGSTTLTTGATWDCNMGKLMSSTDENSHTSNFTYDLFGRPYSQTDPSGLYELDERYPSATSSTLTDSTYFTTTNTVDGLGRPIRSQTTDGASYATVTSYRSFNGAPNFYTEISESCLTTLGADCALSGTSAYDHYNFGDPLGRSISASTNFREVVNIVYTQNDVQTTLTPAPSGENNKVTQSEYDGLGRVISTCALQTTGGTSCGQIAGGSGILTTYSYATAAHLLTVTATRGSQVHATNYDALGRMTSSTIPEAGTTVYAYDGSGCTGGTASMGNLTCVTDANGTHTIYFYDVSNRLTDVNAVGNGNCRRYRFDTTSNAFHSLPTGYGGTNLLGRLMEAETDNCVSPYTAITDEYFAYDDDGRVTDMWEITPHSGGWYHTQAGYAVNGQLTSISGVPGKSTYTIGLDTNGRPDTSTYGATSVATNVTYDSAGKTTRIDYGSDNDVFGYDPYTGLMTNFTYTLGTTTYVGTPIWNANRTLNKLTIVDGFNAVDSQTCNFNPTDHAGTGYDDVGRLVGAYCGAVWSQTYGYDQYDNLTKSGTTNWNPGYSTANNHITGAGYDSDGQVTYDLNNSFAWDGYHKMITANSGPSLGSCGGAGVICLTYDALGRAVEKNLGGTFTEYLYSPAGLTAIMSGQTANAFRAPIPGGAIFTSNSTGNIVSHLDWLGSSRLSATLGHTVSRDTAFSPYGEDYASTGTGVVQEFAGMFTDHDTNVLFDTPNRQFDVSSGSRWLTPDPARASWNAYAYPTNPNSMIDPSGLDAINSLSPKRGQLGDVSLPPSLYQGNTAYGSAGNDWGMESLASLPISEQAAIANSPVNVLEDFFLGGAGASGSEVTGAFAGDTTSYASSASLQSRGTVDVNLSFQGVRGDNPIINFIGDIITAPMCSEGVSCGVVMPVGPVGDDMSMVAFRAPAKAPTAADAISFYNGQFGSSEWGLVDKEFSRGGYNKVWSRTYRQSPAVLEGNEGRGDVSPLELNQALTQQNWFPDWLRNAWNALTPLR